ncbi:MAG: tetratricopeptide repeat protein [Desulfovibrio sp.]|jgi:tetratricopeptide (TPR) repeat protein|nr:tetratricopeptide repeat protein [Desulfovibrio sp.]
MLYTCRPVSIILLGLFVFLSSGCEPGATFVSADDVARARSAIVARDWPLAERLLRRALRTEQNADRRWEAWDMLLTAVNAEGEEPRVSLEYLEVMLEEFAENEGRAGEILRRMGRCAEMLRHFPRAADVWSSYLGLADLRPEEMVNGYRHLAQAHFNNRRFEAGEEVLNQCLGLPLSEHDKILCMYDIADQNAGRQRWQDVADISQQILDSEPDGDLRGLTAYLLADALEQLGRKKEALEQFEKARADYPNPAVIDNRIAYLRKKPK